MAETESTATGGQAKTETVAVPGGAKAGNPLLGFLNSGIGILLLTTVISTFVVPQYQRRQQELEWKRQQRADNAKFKLGVMRDCVKEFIAASAYTSEAYELVSPLIHADSITQAAQTQFKQKLTDLQSQRFRQNGKVIGLLSYFPNRQPLHAALEDYIVQASRYMRSTEEYARLKQRYTAPGHAKLSAGDEKELADAERRLDDLSDINDRYDKFIDLLNRSISDEEKRYENAEF